MSTEASFVDFSERIPNRMEFNHTTTTEVVAWDPENEEEVRYAKRELLAWDQ